jgi:hypothetical protein
MTEPQQPQDDTQKEKPVPADAPYGCRKGCTDMALIGCLPALLLIVSPPAAALLWLVQAIWSLI